MITVPSGDPRAFPAEWFDTIDVCEHHLVDFVAVERRGVRSVVVRAGRGTRQDARWIEHVRAVQVAGMHVGSYWHVYPASTDPHHQAELWASAIAGASSSFAIGHWADVTCTGGMGPPGLARYLYSFLARADELFGAPTGISSSISWWREDVGAPLPDRPTWLPISELADPRLRPSTSVRGARLRRADRGGPGQHRLLADLPDLGDALPASLSFRYRTATESTRDWQSRWARGSDVAELQSFLRFHGAGIDVDGTYGPDTDAAVRTFLRLVGRDRTAVGQGCDASRVGTVRTVSL